MLQTDTDLDTIRQLQFECFREASATNFVPSDVHVEALVDQSVCHIYNPQSKWCECTGPAFAYYQCCQWLRYSD